MRSLSIYETGLRIERERERERERGREREGERVKVMKSVRVFFLIYREQIIYILLTSLKTKGSRESSIIKMNSPCVHPDTLLKLRKVNLSLVAKLP